jgi:hypothetical protein
MPPTQLTGGSAAHRIPSFEVCPDADSGVLSHLLLHGLEVAWDLLKVPKQWRRFQDLCRLHRALPVLSATSTERATILVDPALTLTGMSSVLLKFQLHQAQTVFETFFPNTDSAISVWTEVDGSEAGSTASRLRGFFPDFRTPPGRHGRAQMIEMDQSVCGLAFRNPSDDPIYVPSVASYKELLGDRFQDYQKHVQSLVVAVIRVGGQTGVFKAESRVKNLFQRTPSLDIAIRHVLNDFATTFAMMFLLETMARQLEVARPTYDVDALPPGENVSNRELLERAKGEGAEGQDHGKGN